MKHIRGHILKHWIRYRIGTLLLTAACAGIGTLVLALYHLPVEAVLYAALLCGCLLTAVGIGDGISFYRRHRQLESLQNSITVDLQGLPVPRNLLEQDYRSLIERIHADKMEQISKADRQHSSRMEYDTLWVHQIKTPIAAMRLLLQNDDSEQNRDLLAELFQIERYANMVLTYSRLDSDQTDLVIRSCSLDDIVRHTIHRYAPLFVRRKIHLDLHPLKGQVLTDKKWLSFVIEQLLSNALKYTPIGGCITIYQEGTDTLVIADNGIGIAAEDLPRLGERGFTGYNGRLDQKATGLGLYLCRRILHTLSHRMIISSEPGKGTQVRLLLATDPLVLKD